MSKKQYNDSMIGVYDDALSKEECDKVINIFDNSGDKLIRGRVFVDNDSVIDESAKSDIELLGTHFSDGSEVSHIIFHGLIKSFKKYQQKYDLGLDRLCEWEVDQHYNLQKYDGEKDGYFTWHCEAGGPEIQGRIMAWMIYLNDAQCGTDFLYYSPIKAKRGRCLIWPAAWTHTHRAVLPNKGLKYFATGWFHFK